MGGGGGGGGGRLADGAGVAGGGGGDGGGGGAAGGTNAPNPGRAPRAAGAGTPAGAVLVCVPNRGVAPPDDAGTGEVVDRAATGEASVPVMRTP